GVQEAALAREPVGRPEPVERPGLAASPGAVATPALLRGLAQELAGVQVEDALVRDAAVTPNQEAAGGQAVLVSDAGQVRIPSPRRGMEDDADVHHDVDEEAVEGQEAPQVAAVHVEAQGECAPGVD